MFLPKYLGADGNSLQTLLSLPHQILKGAVAFKTGYCHPDTLP